MTKFVVKYEINIEADTPEEAALQTEQILKEMEYRPYLTVTDSDGNETHVDMDKV